MKYKLFPLLLLACACSPHTANIRIVYSDGTVTICNYSDAPYDYDGNTIAAQNWLTVKGK